jgi:hypothetical protein
VLLIESQGGGGVDITLKSMKNSGWIRLHRKLLNNCVANKPEYGWLWINLLLLANHKETTFIWNNEKQTVKQGL